jgi:hypothetical protein
MNDDRMYSITVLVIVLVIAIFVLFILFVEKTPTGKLAVAPWETQPPSPGIETELKCINNQLCPQCCAKAGGYHLQTNVCTFDPMVFKLRGNSKVLQDYYGCQAQ